MFADEGGGCERSGAGIPRRLLLTSGLMVEGFQESTSALLVESFSSFILIFLPEITDRGAFCGSSSAFKVQGLGA